MVNSHVQWCTCSVASWLITIHNNNCTTSKRCYNHIVTSNPERLITTYQNMTKAFVNFIVVGTSRDVSVHGPLFD